MTITVKNWLAEQPFALAMSSGFFGFYAHLGVSTALAEVDLTPSFVCGSSAGAIVASAIASQASMSAVREQLFELKREEFWDPGIGLGLLKGRLFESKLSSLLPCQNIEDCPTPLSISVFDCFSLRSIQMQAGNISKAVRASCSVPGLFQPVVINKRVFVDGGLSDKAGLNGISWSGRVLYHHLLEGRRIYNAKRSCLPRFSPKHNTCSIIVERLPYVNPFKLKNGRRAFDHAYASMRKILSEPMREVIVA